MKNRINTAISAMLAAVLGALLLQQAGAQNAAPADRNAINTSARPGGMMADSPVTFPKEGALPSKFPPDVPERTEAVEKDYYLFSTPCRSLAQINAIQAEMPKGQFAAPPGNWAPLSRTRRILTEGGDLRLMAVGDSIVNDTMRSGWVAKLQEAYPKAKIDAMVYVRGGGGCQHYKEEGRVAKYILPYKPNLVYIGGISQKDIPSIREVIHQLREGLPDVEILLATGTFGTADPRDPAALASAPHSGAGAYGQALKELATAEHCAYLDMTTPWAEYIRSSKLHPHLFYRDVVHANEHGEQILARIMMAFWTAPMPPDSKPAAQATRSFAPAKIVNFREPARLYVERKTGGWTFQLEKELVEREPAKAEQAVKRLETKLGETLNLLPAHAHGRLRKLSFFLMLGPQASGGGRNNGAEYFRNIDPDFHTNLDLSWRSAVVVYSADNYLLQSEHWAVLMLVHELSHAWQLEQWPEKQPEIYSAWQHANENKLYHGVNDINGTKIDKAYAVHNQLEYFTELSCAYFWRGEYEPFDREALRRYDPTGFAMIEKMWGVHSPPPPPSDKAGRNE